MAYRYNLAEVLVTMGYTPNADFVVTDNLDGGSPISNNPQITEWNVGDPQPTEQEIEDAWTTHLGSSERLDMLKLDAKAAIDVYAEGIRSQYITSQPGQVAVYNEKYLDAKAYKDAGYPTVSGSIYPFVQAEAAAISGTLQDAADFIIATRNMWITLAAHIEEERRLGKVNIEAAISEIEVNTAKQAALDALAAI